MSESSDDENSNDEYNDGSKFSQTVKMLNMNRKDVNKLEKFFEMLDKDRDGFIDVEDLFRHADIKENLFTERIFELLEINPVGMSFSEFFISLVTYCFFEVKDILRFCIHIFDDDGSGYFTASEFVALVHIIHNVDEQAHDVEALNNITKKRSSINKQKQKHNHEHDNNAPNYSGFSATIQAALKKLRFHERAEMRLNIDTMMEINKKFPQLLVPAFDVQVQLINAYGGRSWWDFIKSRLLSHNEEKKKKQEKKNNASTLVSSVVNERKVIREMGIFYYYLCPCFRKEFQVQPARKDEDNNEDLKVKKETEYQLLSRLSEMQARNPETDSWETLQKNLDPLQGGSKEYIANRYKKSDVMRDVRKDKRLERKQQRKAEHDELRHHLTVTGRKS